MRTIKVHVVSDSKCVYVCILQLATQNKSETHMWRDNIDCRGFLQLNSLINYHVNTQCYYLLFTQFNWIHNEPRDKRKQNKKKHGSFKENN